MTKLFRRVLLVALLSSASLFAQTHVGQPAVNLGDTSFLDGIAGPGGVIEVIGDGAHDSKVVDGTGRTIPGAYAVNSISELTHFAWITPKQIFGGPEEDRHSCSSRAAGLYLGYWNQSRDGLQAASCSLTTTQNKNLLKRKR
jgi:hypothetical protein